MVRPTLLALEVVNRCIDAEMSAEIQAGAAVKVSFRALRALTIDPQETVTGWQPGRQVSDWSSRSEQ
jgi:hypothetical protein